MTTAEPKLTFATPAPRFVNDQQIEGTISWVAAALAPQNVALMTALANTVSPAGGSAVVVGTTLELPDAMVTSANNGLFAPNTFIQNKLSSTTVFANNADVDAFQSYTGTLLPLPVVNDQALGAAATFNVTQDANDNSTLTQVDIDWDLGSNLIAVPVGVLIDSID
jgi:hypothetical protein